MRAGARVTVERARLAAGDLPGVCAKTGAPTDRVLPVALRSVPRSAWWLLLLGVVPFLVARGATATRVPARLPLSRPAFRRLVAMTYLGWVLLGAGVVVLGLAAGLSPPRSVPAAAAIAVVVGAACVVLADLVGLVGAVPTDDPDQVTLTRVHVEFARAVRAA